MRSAAVHGMRVSLNFEKLIDEGFNGARLEHVSLLLTMRQFEGPRWWRVWIYPNTA